MPLHLHPLVLPPDKVKKIRSWLGAEGARDFIDYLCSLDAELTAEAGNALCDSHTTDAEVETAKEKAAEACQVRLIIDKMSQMRHIDFKFNYKEPQKQTATTNPNEE